MLTINVARWHDSDITEGIPYLALTCEIWDFFCYIRILPTPLRVVSRTMVREIESTIPGSTSTWVNIASEAFFINRKSASRTVVDDLSGYNVTEVFAVSGAIFNMTDGSLRAGNMYHNVCLLMTDCHNDTVLFYWGYNSDFWNANFHTILLCDMILCYLRLFT